MLEAIFGHYTISILIFCGIWAVLTQSLNVLTGYAGQVSLGHAAFFGIGAYTSALLTTRYGWPFFPAFLGAMVVTALVGGFLGLPSLRVRHDFLVLATMGINFVVVGVFKYVDFFGSWSRMPTKPSRWWTGDTSWRTGALCWKGAPRSCGATLKCKRHTWEECSGDKSALVFGL